MTKQPTAPAAVPSVAEAERIVAERTGELAAIRATTAAAEAELPKLAMDTNDEKFEAKSLEIGRQRRAELRAQKRLEAAKETLGEAKAREEQARRRTLYEAGKKAAAEA